MKKLSFLACTSMIIILVSTLLIPKEITLSLKQAVNLCIYIIVPAFFPYLAISNFLIHFNLYNHITKYTNRISQVLFKTSVNGSFAVLIGFLCGYPIGIKTAAGLYDRKNISDEEFVHLIKFCNNPSIAFVINYVAIQLLNGKFEVSKLIVCTYGASVITGVINARRHGKTCFDNTSVNKAKKSGQGFNRSLNLVITSTVSSLCTICFYILFFSLIITLTEMALEFFQLNFHAAMPFIELTSGLNYLKGSSLLDNPFIITSSLCFGGLCITSQTLSFLPPKFYLEYVKGKLFNVFVSLILTALMFYVI